MDINLANTVKSTDTSDLLGLVPDITNVINNFKQTLLDVYTEDNNGTTVGNRINEYGTISTGSSGNGIVNASFQSSANCLKKAAQKRNQAFTKYP